ncbi:MAG: peptidoglycan-binding protein, partial [Candidatus Harrisonbacteria bacterium]|nr:peptidoglycan-binding protein [Candidatus Harrisonbacteria bacterium]
MGVQTVIAIVLGSFAFLAVPSAYAQTGAGESDVQAALRELKAEFSSLRGTVADLKSQLDAVRIELRAARAANIAVAVPQSGVLPQEVPPVLPNAREVQIFLKNFPDVYPEGLVTGYYGDLTKKAIRKFQERYGGSTNDARVKEFYELVFGGSATPFITLYSPLELPVAATTTFPVPPATATATATTTIAVATTSPSMQRVICPALPTVAACANNEERVVSYSSAACGTYYTCVPRGTVIATSTATATSTAGTAGWRRIAWGRGGSSLVGPNVPQETINARLAAIAASCPNATQYDYVNPSDAALPNAGVPSCPAGAATLTAAVASEGCARYGEGWHAMDASGTCFDPAMQNYRDVNGGALSCASWPISGCSGSTSYAGDANSCPGFAYSR